MKSLVNALVGRNIYKFECYDRFGKLKWVEEIPNLIVNEGLDDVLNKYFKGSGYTAAWYVGLIDNASFSAIAAGDTAAKITGTVNAPTTNAWQEFDDIDEANRPALTLGSVSGQSVDNSASKAAFTINATGTVNGAFVVTTNTILGTSGVLYGAASFSATRAVESGDTINVTVTLTSASA